MTIVSKGRTDLIVPLRDRRQHRRIVTIRNVRNAILVLLVAFVFFSIVGEIRGRYAPEYGRLYSRTLPPSAPAVNSAPPPIVEEQPVADQVGADPMLVQPAARGQWLIEEQEPLPPPDVASVPVAPAARPEGDVTIVGGPNGVAVVSSEQRAKPVLSGGIFKDPQL